jgi:squalene cyclase
VQFLLAKQGADGLWRDFTTPAGEASEWPTAVVGAGLSRGGGAAAAVERAASALVARQNDDGGWGYNEDVPSDADSTACALLFLAGAGHGGSACRRALGCLVEHQRSADGGVATYHDPGPIRRFMGVGRWLRFTGWCSPQVEVTAAAGRALAAVDASIWNAAAAWRYVRSRQRADGSWSAYWWTSPHYATHQVVELAHARGDRDPVRRAAEWAARGAETPAFETALSLSILLRAGSSPERVERAIARLAALQDEDGGWPSHPIMRIPLPFDVDPDRRRLVRFGGPGLVVADQHRTFTSAACVTALAGAALEPFDTKECRY